MTEPRSDAGVRPYPLLFSPLSIRRARIRNRFVFQPHFTALGSLEGMPTDEHVAYYEDRARGGAGLIVVESQAIHPTGKMSRRFVDAWDPAVVPGLRRITEAAHANGATIFSQLTHGGHTSLEHPPHIMWAPTQMPEPSSHFSTKAMDAVDISATIDGFAVSARNAIEGGFDGIEIKIAHDGLLRSFASPFFNRRTDRYGGSFENRMRLSYEVLEAIRRAVGDDVPLGVRICLDEFTAFGYDLDYGLEMVRALEATGLVDYFNADAGSFSSYWMEIPPAAVHTADFERLSRALKESSKLPCVAFGRISPPSRGEEMLRTGVCDMIGMARQLIADPDTPNKLMAGRADLVRMCVACNDACIFQVGQEKAIRCIHNPGAGRERQLNERFLPPAEQARRVVVVGAGPGGLKVAEIAARRGHEVTILERERQLGGQVRLAAGQPEHALVGEVISYLEASSAEHGVTIRRNTTATPDLLRGLGAEVIVVATGSEPNLPRPNMRDGGAPPLSLGMGRTVLPTVPGLDQSFVVSSDDVMSGAVQPRGHVLVVDENGHWEAAGTAEYLADQGCKVTVIASHGLIGEDLEGGVRTLYYRRAAIKGIALRTGLVLLEVGENRVKVGKTFSSGDAMGWGKYVLLPTDEEWIEHVDWVVPVIGRRSREDLFLQLQQADGFEGVQIERVGDCVAPRLIQSTILDATTLAVTI